jgi:hypothetical protein
MQQEEAVAVPKVYRLVVDKEEHIETIKQVLGIDHHITDDYFFKRLEEIAHYFPIKETSETPRINPAFTARPPEMDELPDHVMSSLQTVRKRRHLTLNLHELMTHWPDEGHPIILVVSVASAPGGYVNLVPEALNFILDVVIVIRNGQMTDLRDKGNYEIHDQVTAIFPVSAMYRSKLR